MAPREQLQTVLGTVLGEGDVYFQPPPNLMLKYPCIVYNLAGIQSEYASDHTYLATRKYLVTYIHRGHDINDVVNRLLALPLCSYSSHFVVDGLYHDSFSIFY